MILGDLDIKLTLQLELFFVFGGYFEFGTL